MSIPVVLQRAIPVVLQKKTSAPILVVVVVIGATLLWAFLGLVCLFSGAGTFFDIHGGFRSGAPTAAAGEIPAEYLRLFFEAEKEYGVSWAVLAAIAKVESGFGANMGPSSKGAIGFMQFMPTTWSGNKNSLARDDKKNPSWDTDPERIARFGGYGMDGNGDGAADPFDPEDAVPATARYLAANDFAKDPKKALYHYNHSWDYVAKVLELAERYSDMMLPLVDGIWPLPATFTQVTSGYGPRVINGRTEFHQGMDVMCSEGTPVFAVLPGQVLLARWKGNYGLCVMLGHDGNVVTVYGHLSRIMVREGQKVKQGDLIGLSGNTGRSFGPHLHFEVRVNGRTCDPEEWLKVPSGNR